MSPEELQKIIEMSKQKYEEDIKDGTANVKQEKVDLDKVLAANKYTASWIEEEREYREAVKNGTSEGFRSANKSREEVKEEKKSYSSYYNSDKKEDDKKKSYGYSGYYSSSSSKDTRSDFEKFVDKTQKEFYNNFNSSVNYAARRLKSIVSRTTNWDILETQLNHNKSRIYERYMEDNEEASQKREACEKASKKASKLSGIADCLNALKFYIKH